MNFHAMVHHLIRTILIHKICFLVRKYLVKDEVKMIIGEEILIVSIVINSIWAIPRYILILSKNIVKDPMGRLCHCLQVVEVVEDQKKVVIVMKPQDQTREQRTSSKKETEEADPSTHSPVSLKSTKHSSFWPKMKMHSVKKKQAF